MDNNNEQPPDEPVLTPFLTSLAVEDIPTLDLQLQKELNKSDNRTTPGDGREPENTEYQQKHDGTISATPSEKLLSNKNILVKDQLSASLDAIDTEYGGTSGSEPDFASDSEFWTDEDEETTDDLVRSLTSHRDQPFENSLSSPYPRHRSLGALELPEYIAVDPAPLPLTPSPTTDIVFENDHFSIKRSEIAGWGAFAAQELRYGDRILVEKPLFIANSTTLFKEFDKLSQPLREIALGLHANSSCKPGTPRIKAIWTTNCFSTGGGDEAGLFPVASRFNHSCHPKQNIHYFYNPIDKVLEMVVRANVIKTGEELTISYGTRRTPADLFFRYGFKCRCGGCAGFSDEELQDMW